MHRPVHFEILSENPERIAAFYRDALGWEIATWNGPQQYWLVTTGADDVGINGGIMHRHFPQPVINTVETAALDELIKRIESAGGKLVHGPTDIPGVGRHAYFADPDGSLFGAMQPMEQSDS